MRLLTDSSDATDNLIKGTLAPINHIAPYMLTEANMRTCDAMNLMHISPKEYRALYASMMLACARQYFIENTPAGWSTSPAANCFHIYNHDTELSVRFLHGFLGKNQVPPAGTNRKRQCDWFQSSLFNERPVNAAKPLSNTSMVVIWTENGGLFDVNAYRPIGQGHFPYAAHTDLRIHLGIPDSEYMEVADLHVEVDDEAATLIPVEEAIGEINI